MTVTVSVNGLTVIHKDSGGIDTAFPDVCKTPTPGGPIPVPYPNVAYSLHTEKGSKSVKVDGNPIMHENSLISTSIGDETGKLGGLVSGTTKGKAKPISYSFDVMVEGEPVVRQTDYFRQNMGSAPNTLPMPLVQPPLVADIVRKKPDNKILKVEFI